MSFCWKKWLMGAVLVALAVCFASPALGQDVDQQEENQEGNGNDIWNTADNFWKPSCAGSQRTPTISSVITPIENIAGI